MTSDASQEEVLGRVLAALESGGIPYMIVGSIAVNYYGQPRFTHDVDFVVRMSAGEVEGLAQALEKEFYVSSEGMHRALRTGSAFNAIHLESNLKADFWPLKRDEFDEARFARRVEVELLGRRAFLTSPEDLILVKLLWFRESESEKHWKDAETVYLAQCETLDRDYLRKWGQSLDVARELGRLEELPPEGKS